MAVIGCDIPVHSLVGAEALTKPDNKGVWVKTLFKQEGNYLTSTTYLVADGTPQVFSMRIDLRPLLKIAAKVHEKLHAQMAAEHAKVSGTPLVGFSFSKAWKSIKKTAKKIGQSKLVKSVGKVVKTVVHSKFVGALATGLAVVVPVVGVPALAAYAAANAATKALSAGKKMIHTVAKVSNTAAKGVAVAKAVSNVKVQATAKAKANVTAAKKIAVAVKAAPKPPAPAVKAKATAQAKAHVAAAKNTAVAAKKVEVKAAPAIAAGAKAQATLANPAVQKQLIAIRDKAASAATTLADIQRKALYGTPEEKLEAQKNKAIVNLTVQNNQRIQAMAQLHAGGLPAMLIDKKGKIIRGRFRVSTSAPGKNPDVLYQGPNATHQSGAFTKIAGQALVGARHPTPFPSLTPKEHAERQNAIQDWLGKRRGNSSAAPPRPVSSVPPPSRSRRPHVGAAANATESVGCQMVLKTPPMPKVAPTVSGSFSIGCDCEGTHF